MSNSETRLMSWLQLIKLNRSLLFNGCRDKITLKKKRNTWSKIHNLGIDLNIISPLKEWKYTRDVVWQKLRKTAMMKATQKKKITLVDQFVLYIIGYEKSQISSQIKNFNFPSDLIAVIDAARKNTEVSELTEEGTSQALLPCSFPHCSNGDAENSRKEDDLKNIKEELEITNIRLKNKKLYLEIARLERDYIKPEFGNEIAEYIILD